MDSMADNRMMGEELVDDKPDNLIWIEQVILNNLDPNVLLTLSQQQETRHRDHNAVGEGRYRTDSINSLQDDVKILVAEIEMRDENYFGDDRVPSLSRILGCRIKFIIEGDEEERSNYWIIKVPPIQTQDRDIARIFGVARREIFFYCEILPALRLWVESQYIDQFLEFQVPPCYYGKYVRMNDPTPDMELIDHIPKAESLLVLEDLRAAEFGKRYFGKGMEISEVLAAVTEITKFHAVSYAMQKKAGEVLGWGELLHWADFVKLYEQLFKRSFTVFESFMSNRPAEGNEAKILSTMSSLNGDIADVLTNLIKPNGDFPLTLVHMDLWSENIMLRVKDDDTGVPLEEADLDCFILDWQMISLGKPTHDLALLIILSMDAEMRREHSFTLLQYYYELFQKTVGYFDLEMPFTYETLIREFSSSCLLAVLMAMCSMDLILMEESTQTRLIDAINDLVEDGILPRQ